MLEKKKYNNEKLVCIVEEHLSERYKTKNRLDKDWTNFVNKINLISVIKSSTSFHGFQAPTSPYQTKDNRKKRKKKQGKTKRDTTLSPRKKIQGFDLMLHEIGNPWLMILNKRVSIYYLSCSDVT